MHLVIRMFHDAQVRVLEEHWSMDPPDMVVSLIPHYNRAFKQALSRISPDAPLVTILTDIADYPPHFWIERQDQYVICGSSRAVTQDRSLGYPEGHILRTSGMILHPKFYEPSRLDRATERRRLGLYPELPTALVSFGAEGSMEAVKVASAFHHCRYGVQLIILCGRHQQATAKLLSMRHGVPVFVQGFTRDVPYYMSLADVFIGKPGPGTISEALAMRLPVIVERNRWTLAHERYNASAVALQNRAVFEIPSLLDAILSDRSPRQTRKDTGSALARSSSHGFGRSPTTRSRISCSRRSATLSKTSVRRWGWRRGSCNSTAVPPSTTDSLRKCWV